ncbi:MAG: lamin tail domain-containing protein, partial [bacterium]|nr:lamin tail domain-containing protein [bacterium]
MRVVKIFLSLIIVTIFGFLLGQPTRAATSTVLINEFAAVTSGTSVDPDWVELYNDSNSIVSLEGWLLRDLTETNKVSLTGCISPNSFRKFNFYTNRLDNGGDLIRLFDQNGSLVDSIEYFSEDIPKHEKGGSTGRISDGNNSWEVFANPTPTNSICATITGGTTSPSLKVSLSEVYPNPEKGGGEWVEIYNPGSTKLDLTNWKLTDAANHVKALSGEVGQKSYKVFNYPSGWLNNNGETLNLLDSAGKLVEKYSFGPSEKGFAWAKDTTGIWRLTITPTPGSANKITGTNSTTAANASSGKESAGFASTGIEPTLDFLADTFQSDSPSDFSNSNSEGK